MTLLIIYNTRSNYHDTQGKMAIVTLYGIDKNIEYGNEFTVKTWYLINKAKAKGSVRPCMYN